MTKDKDKLDHNHLKMIKNDYNHIKNGILIIEIPDHLGQSPPSRLSLLLLFPIEDTTFKKKNTPTVQLKPRCPDWMHMPKGNSSRYYN